FLSTQPTPPQIHTLSLHDALPISLQYVACRPIPPALPQTSHRQRLTIGSDNGVWLLAGRSFLPFVKCIHWRDAALPARKGITEGDRKSTRLNSSHLVISYAVFCLK